MKKAVVRITPKLAIKSIVILLIITFIIKLLRLFYYINLEYRIEFTLKYVIVTIVLFFLFCVFNFTVMHSLLKFKINKINVKYLILGSAAILYIFDSYRVLYYTGGSLSAFMFWGSFYLIRDAIFLLLLYKINHTVLMIFNEKKDNRQITLEKFKVMSLFSELNPENHWVKKADILPWGKLTEKYSVLFYNNSSNPADLFRMTLGALIIKGEIKSSDEDTVRLIQENPYMQFFIGFHEFNPNIPLDPSMMAHFRKYATDQNISEINELIDPNLNA